MAHGFSLQVPGRGEIRLAPDALLFAGFTSRDPAIAEHHRLELEERGVQVPERIPVCYGGQPATLSQAEIIPVAGRRVMGEVEYAAIAHADGVLLTVGVDLFDEDVEMTDIEASKACVATPIARQALALDDVAEAWDGLTIWMACDGRKVQQARLGTMIEPVRLLDLARPRWPAAARAAVVYSGSLPYLEHPAPGFTEVEIGLAHADGSPAIRHRFRLDRA